MSEQQKQMDTLDDRWERIKLIKDRLEQMDAQLLIDTRAAYNPNLKIQSFMNYQYVRPTLKLDVELAKASLDAAGIPIPTISQTSHSIDYDALVTLCKKKGIEIPLVETTTTSDDVKEIEAILKRNGLIIPQIQTKTDFLKANPKGGMKHE